MLHGLPCCVNSENSVENLHIIFSKQDINNVSRRVVLYHDYYP
jgi:hypothetical protein